MRTFYKLCLQLFAEGAAVGGEGQAAGTETGGQIPAEVAAQQNAAGGKELSAGGDSGESSGDAARKQNGSASADGENPEEGTATDEDIEKEYREAMRGKFRKARQKDFDSVLSQRTKKLEERYKGKAEALETLTPALRMYAEKLGVDPEDTAALAEAMQNDPDMVRREALNSGDDPKEALEKKRRRITDSIEQERRKKAEAEEAVKTEISGWIDQAEKLKEEFPDFDLMGELSGEGGQKFLKSLKFGNSVRDTYLTAHLDQIMSGTVAYTARAVKEATAKNISARGMRPAENGSSGSAAAAVTHIDVNNLSSDKIRQLIREAERTGKPVPLR